MYQNEHILNMHNINKHKKTPEFWRSPGVFVFQLFSSLFLGDVDVYAG